MKKSTTLKTLAALATFAVLPIQATEVKVNIENLEAGKGKLYTSLCKQAKFMVGRCDFEIIKKVSFDTETVIFNQLAPGQYAVSVFYDINENEELDVSIFGIPKEPTGVSNNAVGKNGPPTFEDAQIKVQDEAQLEITVKVF